MLEARLDQSPSATVLIQNAGRFFCYEPGLALVASDDSVEGAYRKFVAAKREFFEQVGQAGLDSARLGAKPEPAAAAPLPVRRGIGTDLGLFVAKTCIVLLIIAGIGMAVAVGVKRSVDQLVAIVTPKLSGLPAMASISMTDIADKASVIVRDVQAMPQASKEALRQNVAILSRELTPILEAWRTSQASDGKTDPVSPLATTPQRQ